MQINYKKVGGKIKEARKKQGYTQETLAEIIDLSASHLSHVESGIAKISLPTIVAIAKTLNVSLDDLLSLEIDNQSIYLTMKELDRIFKNCTVKEKNLLIHNLNILKQYDLKEYIRKSQEV